MRLPHLPEEFTERLRRSITTSEERQRGFSLLFFSLLTVGMGNTIIFATLPPIARELGLTESQVGWIFATSAVLWTATSAMWGRRSDVWGRKPIMLIGLVGFGVSTLLFTSVVALGMAGILVGFWLFPAMIATRSIFGFFGSGNMPAATAYVADRTTRDQRVSGVSTLNAGFGLGTILGPGISAGLVVFGILAPFYFVAALALGAAVMIWAYLPERTAPGERSYGPSVRLRLMDGRVLPFMMLGVGLSICQAIQMQTVAFFFMDTLGVSAAESAQVVGIGMMGQAMAALFIQLFLVRRFTLSAQFLMRWGAAVTAVGFALLIISTQIGPLIISLTILGAGFGMLRPGFSSAASLSVAPEEQGSIAGMIGSTAATGHIVSAGIALPLYQVMHTAPYMGCTALMVLLLLFILGNKTIRSARAEVEDEDADTLGPKV